MAFFMYIFVIVFVVMLFNKVRTQTCEDEDYDCCRYCRAYPESWYTLRNNFIIDDAFDETGMMEPPAYMVDDHETTTYDGDKVLKYAGAPVYVEFQSVFDQADILSKQYIEVDLSEKKEIGGILTQGGFRQLNNGDKKVTWVVDFLLSLSNDSINFVYRKSGSNIIIHPGNTDGTTHVINKFEDLETARYIRFHPLRAEQEDGGTDEVNVRVTVLYCKKGGCFHPRVSCLLTEWTEWTVCPEGVLPEQYRYREVVRVQACGGMRCNDTLSEKQFCEAEMPLWQTIVTYGGLAMGIILIILLIAFIIYKKTHQDKVQVIVVEENDDDDDDDMRGRGMASGAPPPAYGMGRGMGMGMGRGGMGMGRGGMGPRFGAPGGMPRFPGPGGRGGAPGGGM